MDSERISLGIVKESIKTLDTKKGVEITRVLDSIGLPDELIMDNIQKLKRDGELYEPAEGRVTVV